MQATLRIHSFPLRIRLFRRLARFLRAKLREESPVVDRLTPENRDRFGFTIKVGP